jgi:hypothetical protein
VLINGSGYEALAAELQLLESHLEDSNRNAFAKSDFPIEGSKSFFEFASVLPPAVRPESLEPTWQLSGGQAEQKASDPGLEIRQLLQQALKCCQAPATPIVAVLGLLNAGKSSLVSTYLSEPNRHRILVGAGNEQGTHRFVLWLPESWRNNAALWGSIQERLLSIFGCASELLSEDPERAMAQYNDTEARSVVNQDGTEQLFQTIGIPLVATDPQLDCWGVALMDCPDVQTGFLPNRLFSDFGGNSALFHERSQLIADVRLKVLASASPLCSAFVVVLPANAMHDQTVSRLLRLLSEKMPRVKQFLAVNRVPRRYEAKEISNELQSLYGRHAISRQYMAYSYDGPQHRDRLPTPPEGFFAAEKGDLPLFFRIDQRPVSQPPATISKEDWLLNIGSQLDKRGLFEDVLVSTISKMRSQINETIHRSQSYVRQQLSRTKLLHDLVANACLDFSTDGEFGASKIRLQVSRQIIHQVSKSLEKTAPWWAMPGRWTTRLAEASKSSIASATHWIQIPQWFSGKTEAIGRWIRTNWSSGKSGKIVTADVLLKHLQELDRQGILQLDSGESHDSELVRSACQRAIDRFQKESLTELDDKQLDEFTSKMWSEMPIGKRILTGFAPAGILFAPLLAVVMVPLDFGGSAVLVFASMKELLLAGAAGVGLAIVSADSMPQIAESEAAWQQMGDLYGVLCDELGLMRPLEGDMPMIGVGSTTRRMPSSRIPVNVDFIKQNTGYAAALSNVVPANYQLSQSAMASIESVLIQMGRL